VATGVSSSLPYAWFEANSNNNKIHVERVIGLSKTFKILKKELPASTRALGSRLIYVCFMLSNFRTCIVHKQA